MCAPMINYAQKSDTLYLLTRYKRLQMKNGAINFLSMNSIIMENVDKNYRITRPKGAIWQNLHVTLSAKIN